MADKEAKAWTQRTESHKNDPHVQEQVRRLMRPLEVIRGTRGVDSYEEVLNTVAQLIATLEIMPEINATANTGGITVVRGPMEGYSIHLHAADVFVMRLSPYAEARDAWNRAEPS